MMNLGSEGMYLDENGGTNPSRYLPGPNTPVKKLKMSILGSRGVRTLRSRPSDPYKSRVDLNRRRDCTAYRLPLGHLNIFTTAYR